MYFYIVGSVDTYPNPKWLYNLYSSGRKYQVGKTYSHDCANSINNLFNADLQCIDCDLYQ